MWHENGRVRCSYCSKNPFFECSFHEITIEFLLELVQKAAEKKLNRQTRRQTNRQNPADPEQLRGRVLDSQNADTSRKCLKNLSPKRPLNPANIPVKEHLRLASVVALSSNGACGAKTNKILVLLLELNPRGQVAPQVHVTNCDATKQTERGWRRRRHLRRVQRPRQAGGAL